MRQELGTIFSSLSIEEWKVKQVVVLDWYDGPREGLCELLQPYCCFYFRIFAEQFHKDKVVDSLFEISQAPDDAVDELLHVLSILGQPNEPIWIPIWSFPSNAIKLDTENRTSSILANLKHTNIILQTRDMENFAGYWYRYNDQGTMGLSVV